jgi:hypothetical protein
VITNLVSVLPVIGQDILRHSICRSISCPFARPPAHTHARAGVVHPCIGPTSPAAAQQLLGMLVHRFRVPRFGVPSGIRGLGSGTRDPGPGPHIPDPGPWDPGSGPLGLGWGGPSKGKYRVFGPSQGPWARAQRPILRVNIGYLGPPRGPGPGPRGRFERKYKGFGALGPCPRGPGTPILGPILGPFWGPK